MQTSHASLIRAGGHGARRLAALLIVCAAAAPRCLHAQSAERSALVARIDSIVNATRTTDRTPGITIAVVRASDTIALKGYGLADVENNVPVSEHSVFRIGSVTKQFTSAAVMKLVEQGKIRLDATLADYLPDYTGPGRRVTIHQLLNHTSGIPSYTGLGQRFWDRSRLDLTHDQMFELFAGDSLQFEPGSRFLYNNSGYYLLGVVLEKVTGEPYAEHLRRALFEPLGLTQTMYCHQRDIIPYRAQGYEVQNGNLFNAAPMSMNQPFAAGSLCSTPRDLVRWTRALHAGRVVSPQSFTMMTTPTRLADSTTNPYGYGLSRGRIGSVEAIQHSGGINGFSAMLSHYPAHDLTIAVIANGPTNTSQLQQRIARAVLGIPEPVVVDLPTTADERARYIGTYDLAPAMQAQITVFEQDGRLFAQVAPQAPLPLRKQAEHTFEGPPGTGIRLIFIMTEGEPRATAFTLQQGGGGGTTAKRIR